MRIDADKIGFEQQDECPNCKSQKGRKLTKEHIKSLAWQFFVRGTTIRCEYGGAPVIQYNEFHYGKSDISPSPWLNNDIKLIEDAVKVGFFHYGPRLWMVGEVEPLKDLQNPKVRPQIIDRILREYPERILCKDTKFTAFESILSILQILWNMTVRQLSSREKDVWIHLTSQ